MNRSDQRFTESGVPLYQSKSIVHSYPREVMNRDYIGMLLGLKIPISLYSVLDVGGGGHFATSALSQFTIDKVITIDLSNEGLSKNQISIVGDAQDIPLRNGSIGIVHAKDMVVHIENLYKFLQAVSRVLVKDGFFILTTEKRENNRVLLYYYNKFNTLVTVGFDFLERSGCLEFINSLRNNNLKDNLIPNIDSIKNSAGVALDNQPISVSPPYYKTYPEAIIRMAQSLGFSLFVKTTYNPETIFPDWYGDWRERTVIVLKK